MSARRAGHSGRGRARVLPALLFALVWLFGYEVLPFAHQAMHAHLGAHSHSMGGHGVTGTHCHGAFCHSDDRTERAPSSEGTRHGQGSLEHRGIAALAHDITIFVPELMLAGEQPIEVALASRIGGFERCSPPVRGPPV